MTKRYLPLGMLALLLTPLTASAQIHQVSSSSSSNGGAQTVNFSVGYFALKGLDSRVDDDVIFNEVQSAQPLLFNSSSAVKDFNGVPVGGEYLFGIQRNFEVGVGLTYSQRTTTTVYANLTNADNSEITQDHKLRQVPVSFTGRFLILPRGSVVEPYVGAGLVAIRYQYSEVGSFVDQDFTIFPSRYVAKGTASGPVVLAGIRAPMDRFVAGGEVRWQKVEAKGLLNDGFNGDKLDLGGWTTNFTLGVRF